MALYARTRISLSSSSKTGILHKQVTKVVKATAQAHVIDLIHEEFDEETCHGSLDYLEETCLEEFARNIRRSTHKFIGRYVTENEQG